MEAWNDQETGVLDFALVETANAWATKKAARQAEFGVKQISGWPQ